MCKRESRGKKIGGEGFGKEKLSRGRGSRRRKEKEIAKSSPYFLTKQLRSEGWAKTDVGLACGWAGALHG